MSLPLLFRPKPYIDESLASYLYRLTNENFCKLQWILEPYKLPSHRKYYQTLNSGKDHKMIDAISQATFLSTEQVKNMTLLKLYYWVAQNADKSLSILPRNSKFCPLCLKEKNYQRIYWQVNLIKICIKHNTFLNEKCLCGKLITPETINTNICECGRNLSSLAPTFNIDIEIYKMQLRLYYAFNLLEKEKQIEIIDFKINKFIPYNEMYITAIEMIERIGQNTNTFVKHSTDSNTQNTCTLMLITNALSDWPNSFYSYLTLLNEENLSYLREIHIKNLLDRYNHRDITPVYFISIESNIDYMRYFGHELYTYFKKNYFSFYEKLFMSQETPNPSKDFVDFSFHLRFCDIKCILNTYRWNVLTFNINKALQYFYNFMKEDNYLSIDDSDFMSVYHYAFNLHGPEDILKIIIEKNIPVKINIFYIGLKMLYIPKNTEKCL